MNFDTLLTDLTTNPLFIIFTGVELAILFYGFYYLYRSHKSTSIIIGLGEKVKSFFELQNQEGNQQSEESINFLNKSDRLTKNIIKLVTSSEQNEMGTDVVSIERILRYENEKTISLVRAAINILPVVGLIGTFLGISIAVYQLSFSSDIIQISETIKSNLKSLIPFLDGIKLAFYTTILALFLALILKILLEFSSTKSKNAIAEFLNYFSIELSEYIKPSGSAEKIAKSISGFSRRVSRLAGDIESSLDKIVENYSKKSESQAKLFGEKINELNNIQEGIVNSLKALWDHISETLNHTTEQIIKASDYYTKIGERSLTVSEQMSVMALQFQEVSTSQIENTTKIGFVVRKLSDDNEKMIKEISNFIHPLDDLRLKFESVLNKSIELNEPFKETNIQLKENFEKLVQSINDLQIKNSTLVEKLNIYANSLESNLGAKLNKIVEAEDQGQLLMKSLNEVQINLNNSVENLNVYSNNLGEASQILVKSIDNQLNALFVDLSNRQNIAINVNNSDNESIVRIESVIGKQNKIFNDFSKSLKNLNETMDEISSSLIKPPFFSKSRWFGNGNQKVKKRMGENFGTEVINIPEHTKD